ncbi:MAG: DUF655 domain-containing protein [Nostocaceae cyanobacterium]|nr:DUF655 domain-containing protein [Nostocaceae cyanobacterium]
MKSLIKVSLVSVIFILVVILLSFRDSQNQKKRLSPLPQNPFVQAYFNHNQAAEYTEHYRQQPRPGDDLEKQIIDAISQAKSSIDVAVQELRLPQIAQALVNKQKAGVKVRVILENTYSRPWTSFTDAEVGKLDKRQQDRYNELRKFVDINRDNNLSDDEINQRDALAILNNAKIPIIDDTADGSKGSSLMHHKFVIIDKRLAVVTSANFTFSDIHGDFSHPDSLGNANNLLRIESTELAALLTEEFNLMWGDGIGGKPDSKFGLQKPLRPPQIITLGNTKITVNFSPASPTQLWSKTSNGLIGQTLDSATQSVDMALFVFSEQRLANILENKSKQQVNIRALISPDFAYRPYSEALDMMGVSLGDKCKYEVDNQPWKHPISTVGIPLLAKGDLLHHKFGVIDKQTVITGSHNWSEEANHGNDETLLVIQSSTVAAHYEREFERLYANARVGVPAQVQDKIKAQEKQCGNLLIQTSNKDDVFPYLQGKINLNTASLKELEALPGVGKKLAQRIIIARQQKKFTSLEDLDRVPGVGSRMLENLRDRVTW